MTTNLAAQTRHCAVALMTAALAVVLAGCTVSATASGSSPVTPRVAAGVPVVLRFGNHAMTATLADTPESRQFAAMLPMTVKLKDVWGQAKSGPLPGMLTAQGTVPTHDPVPGSIYFWPQTEVIAIYYDDLDQAVPDPGLVRLGVIDTGLDILANAGSHVTLRIDLADAATSS